jgi:hypothetical protein
LRKAPIRLVIVSLPSGMAAPCGPATVRWMPRAAPALIHAAEALPIPAKVRAKSA